MFVFYGMIYTIVNFQKALTETELVVVVTDTANLTDEVFRWTSMD